jgi:hypothetical protein
MKEGCGRFSTKVASWSPLTVTSFRFCHHTARGFLRKSSGSLPVSRFQVHCTSLAVNGLPSCHLTPWRSLKVSLVLLASQAQLSARSGTMVSTELVGLV